MSIEFYIPQQGDTAGTVTDGYASNFEALDTVKADAQVVSHALAGKVDKSEGKDLMTSAEREKLAGIEAGANAYTLPAASALALGGVKAGDNVTIAEDGTLSAAAEPYELPKASASVLGGIKLGNNLTAREDGTVDAAGGGTATVSPDAGNTLEQRANGLFVPAGSGGSGSGGGILVLPHVAPERDVDGNLTNSAAFVDAWGGILSAYLAAPDSHVLYMDTEAGEGQIIRIPCTAVNMGGETDAVQWLISGFAVVNIPASADSSASCKATVMAAVICNAAGEMQSLAMYAGEGIAAADGSPNLLGSDDAVIIDLGLDTGAVDEAKLKAAVQPVLAKLMTPTPPRVIVKCNAFYINGTFQTLGSQFVITAYGAHPYAVGDVNNTYIIRAGVIGTIANGTITTVQGGYVGQELTTTEAVKTAINEIPYMGENLLLESRGPWIRHSMGDIKALPLSVGFLTQGETYVFSYVDGCTAPAYPTFHLLTRNGPDIIQQIEPGVPFVATRADWEYILIRKGNEGGICTVSRLKLERGTKVTSWTCAPTEAGPLPYSLDEQLVPGEFWDGKQVYVRSFKGQMPNLGGFTILTSGVDTITNIQASVNTHPYNSVPPGVVFTFDNNASYDLLYQIYSADGMIYLSTYGEKMAGVPYTAIIKYTKA